MPTIQVNLANTTASVAGWTTFNQTSAGVLSSDVSDDSGSSTGVALSITTAFTGAAGSGAHAATSPDPDWPVAVLRNHYYAGSATAAALLLAGLPPSTSMTIELAGNTDSSVNDTRYTVNGTIIDYLGADGDAVNPPVSDTVTADANGDLEILVDTLNGASFSRINGFRLIYSTPPAGPQVIRKGSQFTVEETLAGNVVSATLNGNAITVDSHVGTTVTLTDTGSGITTSGEYPLVLTDDSATPQTETITVQVNVVGLPIYNLNKDGADLASLADVEVLVMTGAAGSRAVSQNTASEVTDVSGNTVAYEVTDTALTVDQNVFVVIHSAAGDVGIAFTETLELI